MIVAFETDSILKKGDSFVITSKGSIQTMTNVTLFSQIIG
jgi:hypothetical protein